MLSPMPRRSFETPSSLPTSPAPRSVWFGRSISVRNTFLDIADDVDDPLAPPPLARASTVPSAPHRYEDDDEDEDLQTDSGVARCISWPDTPPEPFRYAADEEDEAVFKLRLETHLDMRCSSPASTTATALSPMSTFPLSPASSPDQDFGSDDIDAPSPGSEDQKHQCPPGALDASSCLNARKVFVGGIPPFVDGDALYRMFSKFGKVKKAWVQLVRNDQGVCRESPGQKHRGFAFVIFCEEQSVDALLGTHFSRLVRFDNDMRSVLLEVKRLVSKETARKAKRSTMESPVPYPTIPRNTEASSHTFPSASPVGLQRPSCPSPWQVQSFAMAPQAVLIPVQFVPAFPVQATLPVQWPPLGGITVSSYPPVAPAPQQIRQQPNSSVAQAGQQNPLDQQPDISELVTERWGEKREI